MYPTPPVPPLKLIFTTFHLHLLRTKAHELKTAKHSFAIRGQRKVELVLVLERWEHLFDGVTSAISQIVGRARLRSVSQRWKQLAVERSGRGGASLSL